MHAEILSDLGVAHAFLDVDFSVELLKNGREKREEKILRDFFRLFRGVSVNAAGGHGGGTFGKSVRD